MRCFAFNLLPVWKICCVGVLLCRPEHFGEWSAGTRLVLNAQAHNIRDGLHRNIGSMCNPALYKHTHIGTKVLIQVMRGTRLLCGNRYAERVIFCAGLHQRGRRPAEVPLGAGVHVVSTHPTVSSAMLLLLIVRYSLQSVLIQHANTAFQCCFQN